MAMNPVVSDLNVILAFVAALLGFPAGIAVAYLAKEELRDARKYLMLMQHFLLAMAVMFLLYSFELHFAIVLAASLIAFFASMAGYVAVKNWACLFAIDYAAYGIICFLSAGNLFILIVQLSILFLFGLSAGSMIAERFIFTNKRENKIAKKSIKNKARKKK